MASYPYKDVFALFEQSLLNQVQSHAKHNITKDKAPRAATTIKDQSDDLYFWLMTKVVFYSGTKAAMVSRYIERISHWFPDIETVAAYDEDTLARITADETMLRHTPKIKAVINNARAFIQLRQKHGSFYQYLTQFDAAKNPRHLQQLRADLMKRFGYLGPITVYHFLMECGFDVIKPDLVLMRIFHRLGLLESETPNEKNIQACIQQGIAFSKATNYTIRYIDRIFVIYGQVSTVKYGIEQGICLGANPRCSLCLARPHCQYTS